MVERAERKPSLKQQFKAYRGVVLRLFILRGITETPLFVEALIAPKGEMVREGKVRTQGGIINYSGEPIIITDEGEMVFPNHEAGDIIKPLPRK